MKITEYMVSPGGMGKNYIIITYSDTIRSILEHELKLIIKEYGMIISEIRENRMQIIQSDVNILFLLTGNPYQYYGLSADMVFIHNHVSRQDREEVINYFSTKPDTEINFFEY